MKAGSIEPETRRQEGREEGDLRKKGTQVGLPKVHQGPSKGLQDNIFSLHLAISLDSQSPMQPTLTELLLGQCWGKKRHPPPKTDYLWPPKASQGWVQASKDGEVDGWQEIR